jgi:FtsP/CotA-like multicopper oxidase with cupredoxin domain
MELQHRLSVDEEHGQEDRLLSKEYDEKKGNSRLEYKVEWHLRTGWVIASSLLTVIGVFIAMAFFTNYYIVESVKVPAVEEELSSDFRRSSNDYILDPNWDANAPRTVREYKWIILDRIANPDGVYRPMLTINGKFPGPLIECNEGDTLVIEVENRSVNGETRRSHLLIYRRTNMYSATLIHFHGIFQNGTNWMDGTTGITQCPIAPGGRFHYEFTVSGQSGTYFYHGHQAVQMADGLLGPLVIHSRNERDYQKIPYATDRVVLLQDYYHELSHGLLKSSLEPGSETAPIPDAALINGYVFLYLCLVLPISFLSNSECGRGLLGYQNFVEWIWPFLKISSHRMFYNFNVKIPRSSSTKFSGYLNAFALSLYIDLYSLTD